jgi:hypothetical protein
VVIDIFWQWVHLREALQHWSESIEVPHIRAVRAWRLNKKFGQPEAGDERNQDGPVS